VPRAWRREEEDRPGLRLVPDLQPGRHAHPDDLTETEESGDEEAATAPGPAGRVPLPAETSDVVARLAQLLREDPTLATTWGREAQES
jgi:hypothetical protein